MNYKDISEIRQDYNDGKYTYTIPADERLDRVSNNHVFDENLSIKRNNEMIAEHNARVEQQRKDRFAKQATLDRQLHEDVVNYLMGTYDFSRSVAEKIESRSYSEKHSYIFDYLSDVDDLGDFVSDILRMAH